MYYYYSSSSMAPKKKVPDAFTPLNDQVVRGWPFRVRGDGLVTVGTAAGGNQRKDSLYMWKCASLLSQKEDRPRVMTHVRYSNPPPRPS